jgi:o-succinylbenzoate synthase
MTARYWSYTYQFKRPAGTSRGVMHDKPAYFIEVTVDGATGQGECGLLPGLSMDDRPEYTDQLESLCNFLKASGDRAWREWASHGLPHDLWRHWLPWPSILFAWEQALRSWSHAAAGGDGKRLFDTAFSRGECGIPINGLLWMGDRCYLSEQSEVRIQEGFDCIKMKIGALALDQERAILTDLRHLRPELQLRVDANGAFSSDEALAVMEDLQAFDLHSVEQPCPASDREGLARVAAQGAIPTALDESLIGVTDPSERDALLDQICPAYIVLKPSLLGGFRSSEDWIQRAEARGIGWWVTSALEGATGLSAIAQWASSLPLLDGYQGLGTGSLYTNNLPARTEVKAGQLWMR